MLEPQSANVTIHAAVSLVTRVIVIPFNKIAVYADNNIVFDFKAAASRATLLEK
jgi:hypothetical protein